MMEYIILVTTVYFYFYLFFVRIDKGFINRMLFMFFPFCLTTASLIVALKMLGWI